jgi:hypothetical protein
MTIGTTAMPRAAASATIWSVPAKSVGTPPAPLMNAVRVPAGTSLQLAYGRAADQLKRARPLCTPLERISPNWSGRATPLCGVSTGPSRFIPTNPGGTGVPGSRRERPAPAPAPRAAAATIKTAPTRCMAVRVLSGRPGVGGVNCLKRGP